MSFTLETAQVHVRDPLGPMCIAHRWLELVLGHPEHRSEGEPEVVQRSEPCDELLVVEPGRLRRD